MLKYKHHVDTKHLIQNCQNLYPKQFAELANKNFGRGINPLSVLGMIGIAIWASEVEPELMSKTIDMHGQEMFDHVKEDVQIALAVIGTKFCLPEDQK